MTTSQIGGHSLFTYQETPDNIMPYFQHETYTYSLLLLIYLYYKFKCERYVNRLNATIKAYNQLLEHSCMVKRTGGMLTQSLLPGRRLPQAMFTYTPNIVIKSYQGRLLRTPVSPSVDAIQVSSMYDVCQLIYDLKFGFQHTADYLQQCKV